MVHLHGRGGKTPQGFGAAHCTHISISPHGHYIIVIIALLSIFIFLVTIWGGNAGVTRREGCLCQIVNPSYSRSYQGLTILSDTLACLESTIEIINSISQWVTQCNMLQNTVIWFLTRYCMLFINSNIILFMSFCPTSFYIDGFISYWPPPNVWCIRRTHLLASFPDQH